MTEAKLKLAAAGGLVLLAAVLGVRGWRQVEALRADEAPAPVPAAAVPTPADRPDIVLVVVDTLRGDHLSVNGYARPTSPHIDALAARGLNFRRAYAQSGWTLASFASLFTGLYPHQHGVVRDTAHADRFGCLPAARTTVAEALHERGYATAAFVNNTFLAPEFGLAQGFDRYDYHGATNERIRSASATVAQALAWLDEPRTGPSYLVVHFMEPHRVYAAPSPFLGRFAPEPGPPELAAPLDELQRVARHTAPAPPDAVREALVARYDEEVLAADAAVGELVAGLERRGRVAGTLLVVTADHGEEFWEHGGFEHGHSLLGELTRVPLVVAGPGVPVGEVATVVEHADLVQGLLARAGAAPLPDAAGVDLFRVAQATGLRRTALSENCLYGAPCVALVGDAERLSWDPVAHTGAVLPVAEDGREGAPLAPDAQAEPGGRLLTALGRRRGGLEPLTVSQGPRIPSFETFEMLSQLGYLEADAAPSAAGAPAAREAAAPCGAGTPAPPPR